MPNRIVVVDAIMGSGKTSWAIQQINALPESNILYVTPFLAEDERIKRSVNRKMIAPKNFGNGKLGNIVDLLNAEEDIATTHQLFKMLDDRCKDAIRRGKYILFLDEVLDAVTPYTLDYADDINYLRKKGSIAINSDGFVVWVDDDDLETRFQPIKILAQNHCLFYVNQKLLMWRYSPEIFQLFDQVYVMTYMFNASILRYYFDLCKVKYTLASIRKDGEHYELCNYYKPDASIYKRLIHIYDRDDLNDIFRQKASALSKTWFDTKSKQADILKLKNAIYNYFANKRKAKSDQIMWSTFKTSKNKLKGKGYSTKFVACNCRSTNDYSKATDLCYALNLYAHPGVAQFFLQHNMEFDQDTYALSEMLQWIWRSNIREGGEIHIYLPSKRMRKLLTDWLDNKNI